MEHRFSQYVDLVSSPLTKQHQQSAQAAQRSLFSASVPARIEVSVSRPQARDLKSPVAASESSSPAAGTAECRAAKP
eukprot:12457091-Heterocapsa_arctica.AAC.1